MPLLALSTTATVRWRLLPAISLAPVLVLGAYACARNTTPEPVAARVTPTASANAPQPPADSEPGKTRTGKAALGDWTTDAPGVRRKITLADLPKPYATEDVDNGPRMVDRPEGAQLHVPPGFVVEEYAGGFDNPRNLITAPNGDLFITESDPGRIKVAHPNADGKEPTISVFATSLNKPFGLAFFPPGPNPQSLYVGNTDSVVRFAYHNGDLQAQGGPQTIVPDIPSGSRLRGGGHWTRDVKFSANGKKMYVSVGSVSNDYENPNALEARRADILEYNPDGSGFRTYASGIRNAVGLAIHPQTGQLWCSVNERDRLGDDLVPDYITHVEEGGFYGWPWFYMGGHQDPRHPGEHPELKDKVLTPDVLVQAHMASLVMCFYTGTQFPQEYRNDGFAAEHGSWNRARRVGYKIIRVPLHNGEATGEYEDFVTGFVTPEGNVWGRPVGVTVGKDGSLFFTDDGGNLLWRVSYKR